LELSATTVAAQNQVLIQDKIGVSVLKMTLDMNAEKFPLQFPIIVQS